MNCRSPYSVYIWSVKHCTCRELFEHVRQQIQVVVLAERMNIERRPDVYGMCVISVALWIQSIC